MALSILFIIVILVIAYQVRKAVKSKTANEKILNAAISKREGKTTVKHSSKVEVLLFQAMETIKIVCESNDIKTVESRFDFLYDLLTSLENISRYPYYFSLISKTEEKYKDVYNHKRLTEEERHILFRPAEYLNTWTRFTSTHLLNAYKRYVKKQQEDISNLKTETGKNKGWICVIEKGYELKEKLDNKQTKEDFEIFMEQLKIYA